MNKYARSLQQSSFYYDSTYKGIVATLPNSSTEDPVDVATSNQYYFNHFHEYGYLIGACAVLAHLDPTWLAENKAWVDMLVIDSLLSIHTFPH